MALAAEGQRGDDVAVVPPFPPGKLPMPPRPFAALAVALSLTALGGCLAKAPPPAAPPAAPAAKGPVVFPELGPSRVVEPGVRVQEATIDRGDLPHGLWTG